MEVFYADTPDGCAAWLDAWQRSAGQEPFAHPGYVALYASVTTRACVALYTAGDTAVLYPFLLRNLTREAFFPPAGNGPAYDIVTPYGYGGPVVVAPEAAPGDVPNESEGSPVGIVCDTVFADFYRAFTAWAADMGVVSEFVRFSLFSEAQQWYYGLVEHNNDNIVVSLGLAQEELWKGFRRKVRKNVRTAEGHGLAVEGDPEGRRLDEFLEVYLDTMRRRRAAPFYHFARSYFVALQQALGSRCRWFHVLHEDRVVASELVLCGSEAVYSFLGGTHKDYFALRAGDLLKFGIVAWAAKEGYGKFVIGGGYRPHDGIFAFKKSFAPQGVVPFYTGKKVFDPQKYRLLCQAAGKTDEGFFPAYRG